MQPQGDCVACTRCVQVCPTGIDIRNGLQLECIACTACVDACDEIMTKLKKPKGLIRYTTLRELNFIGQKKSEAEVSQERPRFRMSIRSSVYLAIITISAVALTTILARIKPIDIQVIRGKGLPYQVLQIEGVPTVLNQFFAEATNTTDHPISVSIELLNAPNKVELMTSQQTLVLPPLKTDRIGFFVKFPAAEYHPMKDGDRLQIRFKMLGGENSSSNLPEFTREVRLVAPIEGNN